MHCARKVEASNAQIESTNPQSTGHRLHLTPILRHTLNQQQIRTRIRWSIQRRQWWDSTLANWNSKLPLWFLDTHQSDCDMGPTWSNHVKPWSPLMHWLELILESRNQKVGKHCLHSHLPIKGLASATTTMNKLTALPPPLHNEMVGKDVDGLMFWSNLENLEW